MKRIFLSAFFCLFTAVYASAQYKEYYVMEQVGREYPLRSWFRFDWNNKYFFFDSDSERENDGRMKNFKEEGNKKTFDVWTAENSDFNEKIFTGEFTTEDEHRFTFIQKHPDGRVDTYVLSDVKPVGSPSGAPGESNDPKSNLKDKANSVKNSVTKGISKGLNALKKKK